MNKCVGSFLDFLWTFACQIIRVQLDSSVPLEPFLTSYILLSTQFTPQRPSPTSLTHSIASMQIRTSLLILAYEITSRSQNFIPSSIMCRPSSFLVQLIIITPKLQNACTLITQKRLIEQQTPRMSIRR